MFLTGMTQSVALCPSAEDVLQHPTGHSGPGGREECGEEEHLRRSEGQRAHAQR